MDLNVFFKPSAFRQNLPAQLHPSQLINKVHFFDGDIEELENRKVAIFGVCEDRSAGQNTGCASGPDEIRKHFYQLYNWDDAVNLIDLGNIEAGNEVSDTYYAVNQTCQLLLKRGILPIIMGGSQDITYANYLAYEHMEQTVNLVTIDQRLDFGKDEKIANREYLNRIILHKPNYLFNYSNIGHQRYLVEPELIELVTNMYFDLLRLGEIQASLHLAEPVLRNADIISLDLSSIRKSESPGSAFAGPNGFYGDEAAQLCRYAGMSDKLSSFGLYEYNPSLDPLGHTAQLAAQLIWCFIEGFSQRKLDYPASAYDDYLKYMVHIASEQHELVFYKSHKSDRWWMDVPYPSGQQVRYERHHLVPCTYEEYQQATNEEVPDRWWKTYQKLT